MHNVCRGRSAAGDPMPAGAAPADAEEADDSYLVDINLPGVAAEDRNPKLRDNKLRMSGEVKNREHTGVLGRRGRQASGFEYLLALPAGRPEQGRSEAVRRVLTVRLRKSSADEPRRIEITS